MRELIFLKKYGFILAGGGILFLLLFVILLCNSTLGGGYEGVAYVYLTVPFAEDVEYTITSNFGERIDPIETDKIAFHSGIDLTAPEGTSIVASSDGVVVGVGYQENGLGNYVYLEHDLGGIKLYTMYGHMLDDSIVVKEGQEVQVKDKLGVMGSTGKSTGRHLHFMISVNKISYKKEDLLDPIILINGL